jgi:hypothetical protein
VKELNAPLGTGHRACGCRGCGNVFTSLSGFDQHQRWQDGTLTCLNPAFAGLERKKSGRWGYPGRSSWKG